MFLRHPSRYYIYYLFSRRTLDTAALVTQLSSLGLPLPQEEKALEAFIKALKKERSLMSFPPGFNPGAEEMSKETVAFLKRWKIYDMWTKDPYTERAFEILREPQARRMIEALLLGPLNIASIARRLKDRFDFPDTIANPQVVRAFNHYFWNVQALSVSEWRSLIYEWIPGKDKGGLLMSLHASKDAAGAAMSIAAADNHLESVRDVDMYKAMRDHGFRMFMEHALLEHTSFTRSQGALLAFQIVKMAGEELDKRRGGSAEILDEMKRIETLYDTKKPTSVRELPTLQSPLAIRLPKDTTNEHDPS